jgi:hypothetical protein
VIGIYLRCPLDVNENDARAGIEADCDNRGYRLGDEMMSVRIPTVDAYTPPADKEIPHADGFFFHSHWGQRGC